MKILSVILAVLTGIAISFQISAQAPIVVNEKIVTMSKGDRPAFIVEIPEAISGNVKKSWTKLIRQNTKSKVLEENNEITIQNTQIDVISKNPINIFSAIYQADSTVKLVSLFEIDSSFFSFVGNLEDMNYERTYEGIIHFLHDFAVGEYIKAVEQEQKEIDKELKTFNSDLQKLVKQTESFQKKIKQNESDSLNAETQIISLGVDKERKQGEIDSKKESMSSIGGDKELQDEAKKHLKSLEKQRKKIEKEIVKLKENIVEYQTSNVELKRNIEENSKQKEELLNKIIEQKETVIMVLEKLNNIK